MHYLKQQVSILIVVLLIEIGMKSLHPVMSQFKLRKRTGNEKSFSVLNGANPGIYKPSPG